ncbi:MAG: hypothetical protein GF364_02985 [Candidatus Lokiarchaeota archaeon]|nr:hypothetical protein [Candidatus Lokiarchaeota archaeon]
MKRHQKSFFGQKTGMIFDSSDWEQECVYFTFLSKLQDGNWERPSDNQGRRIKINLGELIMIRRVLMGVDNRWSTVHVFNEEKTSIAISRDKTHAEHIWIMVDKYRKNIRPPETEILLLLIAHIISEKIEHATAVKFGSYNSKSHKVITKGSENNENQTRKIENRDKYKNDKIEEDQMNSEKKEYYCKTFSI